MSPENSEQFPLEKHAQLEVFLLKAAADAASTMERRDLLEGLLDGDERMITRTLEEHPEHADLLDDDFFWCYMGLGMLMGDAGFWRAVGDWGYSLNSTVKMPKDPGEDANDFGTGQGGMTLSQWGMRFLPLERLQWFEKKDLIQPWARGQLLALHGMLYNSRDVFDWLQDSWVQDVGEHRLSLEHRSLPEEMVKLGRMATRLKEQAVRESLPEIQSQGELEKRYDSFRRLYLRQRHPNEASDVERMKAFIAHPPASRGHEGEFSQWLVDSAPEIFSPSWPSLVLSKTKQSWDWADALWEAGAPAGGSEARDALFSRALETMEAHGGSKSEFVARTIRQWMKRASEEDIHIFLEGSADAPPSPLWSFVEKNQWEEAATWISLGAGLGTKNKAGASIGAVILSEALSEHEQGAPIWEAWDVYRKRAATDDPSPPSQILLNKSGDELHLIVDDGAFRTLAREAILNGTLSDASTNKPIFRGSRL